MRVSVDARADPVAVHPGDDPRELNPDVDIEGILPTLVDTRTIHAKEAIEILEENFGDRVFASRIRKTVRFAEAPVKGMSVLKYEPHGVAAQSYRQLAQEVLMHGVKEEQVLAHGAGEIAVRRGRVRPGRTGARYARRRPRRRQSPTATRRSSSVAQSKRASMREGPLAALFSKTEEEQAKEPEKLSAKESEEPSGKAPERTRPLGEGARGAARTGRARRERAGGGGGGARGGDHLRPQPKGAPAQRVLRGDTRESDGAGAARRGEHRGGAPGSRRVAREDRSEIGRGRKPGARE